MSKKKYLHASYLAGVGDGKHNYKSCILTISKNGDYDSVYKTLREHYCQETGANPKDLMLTILSLSELSKSTYKILNGGKL